MTRSHYAQRVGGGTGEPAPAPPGPGRWVRETAHQARPFTRFFLRVWCPAFEESMPGAFRRFGVLMQRLEMREVGIWLYTQPQMAGPRAGDAPAWLRPVLRAAWVLHPEVRRRSRAAARALRTRAWCDEAHEWWGGLRDAFARRNHDLQAVDPRGLADEELRRHVAVLIDLLRDGDMVHMRQLVAQNLAVGDWLAHVRAWTGQPASTALAVLRGSSPASVRPLSGLDELAAAIRAAPAAVAELASARPADVTVPALRACSPAVAGRLDAYLDEHGDDLLGFDLDEPTLREMPELLLSAVRAHLAERPPTGAGAADPLRDRVPARHRAEYDALLADARLLYGLRDEGIVWTEMRPWGLLRRALLAAGERLARRGALTDPAHAVETSPDELYALLGGAAEPTATELAERAARRLREAADPPPLELGAAGPEPVTGTPSGALARVNDALAEAMSQDLLEGAAPPPATPTQLHGTPASPGHYVGTARLVRSPAELPRLRSGDVLIASVTGPAYNVALPLIGALVTDRGGALSHAAVVAREFGLPAVVATRTATTFIPDGALVQVDGAAGVVTLL